MSSASPSHVSRPIIEGLPEAIRVGIEGKNPDLVCLRVHPGTAIDLEEQDRNSRFCAAPEISSWVEMIPKPSPKTNVKTAQFLDAVHLAYDQFAADPLIIPGMIAKLQGAGRTELYLHALRAVEDGWKPS